MISQKLEMIIAAIVLLIFIFFTLKINSLTIKNSIMWVTMPIVFILMAVFSQPLNTLSRLLGFEVLSNFVFFVILGCLLLFCFLLTVIASKQKNIITKLVQDVSILKKEMDDEKKKRG